MRQRKLRRKRSLLHRDKRRTYLVATPRNQIHDLLANRIMSACEIVSKLARCRRQLATCNTATLLRCDFCFCTELEALNQEDKTNKKKKNTHTHTHNDCECKKEDAKTKKGKEGQLLGTEDRGIFLSGDELLRVEELTIGACADPHTPLVSAV